MANDRLRSAMLAAGLTVEDISARVGTDVKTVERWIQNEQRKPHRSTRRQVAELLSVDEVALWPGLVEDVRTAPSSETELVQLYPNRSKVPPTVWSELIDGARERVDVLFYSGTFLVEQYNFLPAMRSGAANGMRVRCCVGDENSSGVMTRAIEEGTVGGLEGRVQLMRRYMDELVGIEGIEVRKHGTPLYNSIYRFDDDMLVNTHSYGSLAGQNPVLHLRRLDGGLMWENYMRSFERAWEQAKAEG